MVSTRSWVSHPVNSQSTTQTLAFYVQLSGNFPGGWFLGTPARGRDRRRVWCPLHCPGSRADGGSHLTLSPLQVETPEEAAPGTEAPSESQPDRVYLDLTPVKSFLHSPSGAPARAQSPLPAHLDPPAEALPADPGPAPGEPLVERPENPELQVRPSASRWVSLPFAAPGPAEPCLPAPKADAAGEPGA